MAEDRIRPTTNPIPTGAEITNAQPAKVVPLPREEAKAAPSAHHGPRDTMREILETVVFVVILVLLLKTFIAEAFVIPTGSMAESLFGHHEKIICPQCEYKFEVNTSKEIEHVNGHIEAVTGATCPNCRFHIDLLQKGPRPGGFQQP